MVQRPHWCSAARALSPSARADYRSIAATAQSSFSASVKGGTSTCGSAAPDSRKVYPCDKGETGERERSGAGATGVRVYCSITRLHRPCLNTCPRKLMLPHAVSSLSILQDRGDVGDSEKGIQTISPSTCATLRVVMTTHLSEGLVRDVHGERHGVATVPPRAHRTRLPTRQQSTQLICVLNLHATVVHASQRQCEHISLKVNIQTFLIYS